MASAEIDDNGDGSIVTFQSVVTCDGCRGEENVHSYCINCVGNLCDTCKFKHENNNLTHNHRVLPRGHPEVVKVRRSISLPCKRHPKREYVTYCNECNAPCCADCLKSDHNGHTFANLEDIADQATDDVVSFIETLEEELLPSVTDIQERIKRVIEQDKTEQKDNKNEIELTANTLINKIDKMKTAELKELERHYSARNKELVTLRGKTEDNAAVIRDLITKFKAKLNICCKLEAILLRAECPALESLQLPNMSLRAPPKFQKASFALPAVKRVIGEITVNQERDDIRFSVDVEIVHSFKAGIPPSTMDVSKSDQIWINCDNQLETCDIDGAEWKNLKFHFTIFDITVSPSQGIFATDSDNKRILRIEDKNDSSVLLSTSSFSPRGICINNKQQLVVGLWHDNWMSALVSKKHKQIKLVVYDLDTKNAVQEIEKNDTGKEIFKHDIFRLTQNGNGDYIVADTDRGHSYDTENSRVVCVSREGKTRWVCDVRGVSDVACDRFHNVILCDSEKCEIDLLDIEGRMTQKLITGANDLRYPFSITVNSEGLLFVGQKIPERSDYTGRIAVVRYLK